MKRTKFIYFSLAITISCFMTSCTVSKNVNFSAEKWSVNAKQNSVTNMDSTYIFALNDRCDSSTLVICCDADLHDYHRLDKYICNLKDKTGLSESQVLVYIPGQNTLWLKLSESYRYERPKSITMNLNEEHPYTMWVKPDEMERWNRKPMEMYTYTYYDKRQKWLCIVDIFNYANTPIARMSILQTETKRFNSIGLPDDSSFPFTTTSIESIEMLSNWVDGHRNISISNFKEGCALK